jgi:hypothetical protein
VQAELKRLPGLTAFVTALDVACLAAFWLANDARVRRSYLPETPARDLARYESWEHFFIAATWYVAFALAPLLVLQLIFWSKIRRATQPARGALWLMLASTLVGLTLFLLLGLAAGVSVGGGLVG